MYSLKYNILCNVTKARLPTKKAKKQYKFKKKCKSNLIVKKNFLDDKYFITIT